MPTIQNYHIYCDEAYIHKNVAFAIGGLICTPRRAEILEKELSAVRERFNYDGELKWNKVSLSKLPLYECFVDVFLNDSYAKFSVMQVIKSRTWNEWGKSEEERFFKTYYVFLKRIVGPFSRYYVYVDSKSLQKGYRWNTLLFLINKTRQIDWGLNRKNIRELVPLDSKTNDLVQLADLLLGCLVHNPKAEAKCKLKQRVTSAHSTEKMRKRIKIFPDWTPQIE